MKKIIIILLVFILCSTANGFYQPFPIFDLRAGKVTSVEPWLLPQDGFETLSNCHLKRGVLEKRRGYTEFGQIVHVNTSTKAPTMKTDPVMGIYNHYSGATEQLMMMDDTRVNKYITNASLNKSITAFADAGGVEVTVTCAGHGFSTYDIVTISGTTNYDGTFSITKVDANSFKITDTWVSDDATGTANQEQFIDLTTSKIRFKAAGVQVHTLLVGDTLTGATSGATATVRAITIDTGTWGANTANGTIHLSENPNIGTNRPSDQSGTFEDEDITDGSNVVGHVYGNSSDEEFTGDNTNFFWSESWKEITYLINNNDVIQKYDGTSLTRIFIDLDVEGGPDNNITRALLIFALKNRIILFDITERGATYHQRARWCEVNDPDTWKDANYLDADTEDWVMSGDFIGQDLYIWFERSIWRFEYTGDPDQPFRWDKVIDTEGCFATMSLLPFSDELIGVGPTQLIGFDRRKAYGIDEKIPDFLLTWEPDSVAYSYGFVIDEEKQGWVTYASSTASAHGDGNIYPDRVVVLNYDDNSFSTYAIPAHCFGYSLLESDLTWNDVGDAWSSIDWSWDEKAIQSGYPINLFGGRDGKIYKLNDGGTDDGSAIEFSAIGGRWNPFVEEGRQARLGWIDFLVDVDANVTFDVKSYVNTVSTPFQTVTITCTAVDSAEDKSWHRVYVNCVGRSHRIEITNNASTNRPRIHCIMPWFDKAGGLY